MTDDRNIVGHDRTPIQQSLATHSADYGHLSNNALYLGVVLKVHHSDSSENRSAMQHDDRRGYFHECQVLCVNTGNTHNIVLDNVTITPDSVCGLDDYQEHLPRGCSNIVDGRELKSSLAGVDPHELDGDWCVVGFIGGVLDQPFIVRWWPHYHNVYDPQTSGQGGLDSNNSPKALNQAGRYFKRVNGVEHVITPRGDVYLSTAYANSELKFDEESSPTNGRWPQDVDPDQGGSVAIEIKPSQTLELSWDEKIDGAGIDRANEIALPQTNPKQTTENHTSKEREKTYIRMRDVDFKLFVPEEIVIKTSERIEFVSEESTTINAGDLLECEADEIKLGENAEQGLVRGDDLKTWLENLTVLTATGPAKINTADIAKFIPDTVSTKVFSE